MTRRRWLWLGCASVIAIAVALSALVALSSRPFSSIDENAHVGYALDVTHGRLPTMDTDVRPAIQGMFRERTYVANHPPLYYAFAGVPLRLGIAAGYPIAGLFAARLLSALFLAAGIAASIWAIRLLLPTRPRLALIGGALFAVFPMFAQLGSVVMNDTAAFASVSLALAAAILVLRRGLTWRRVGLLAAACCASALTRSSGLSVTLIAIAACVIAGFREREAGSRWPSRRALAMTGCIPAAVIVTAAWFYIRNVVLYGDATGAAAALRIFREPPHLSLAAGLFNGHFWENLYQQLFGRTHYVFGAPKVLAYLAMGIAVAGVAVGLVRAVGKTRGIATRRRARATGVRAFGLGDTQVQGVLLLTAQMLLTVIPFFLYASRGGATFSRYLIAGALVVVLAAAWALDALPGRSRGLPAVLALGLLTWVSVQLLSQDLAWLDDAQVHKTTFGRLVSGMNTNQVPAASFLTAALLTVVVCAFAGLAAALWNVGETERDSGPVSRPTAHQPDSAAHRRVRGHRAAAHRRAGVAPSLRLRWIASLRLRPVRRLSIGSGLPRGSR